MELASSACKYWYVKIALLSMRVKSWWCRSGSEV